MKIHHQTFLAVIVAMFALAATNSVDAALIANMPGAPVPVGANFGYDYQIHFGTGQLAERLEPGDFITLYDVGGPLSPLVGTPITNSQFTAVVGPLGTTATGTAPFDNPALSNVTFVYNGPPLTSDTIFTGFRIVTTQSAISNIAYSSETTSNLEAGSPPIGHIGTTRGPLGIIPEPGTVALLAIGALAGLFVFRRTR